jgi:prephenate dehydratase
LGQCKIWLRQHIPNAAVVPTASTAAAARAVAENTENTWDAAICSKICADVYSGLQVLHEGIQDGEGASFPSVSLLQNGHASFLSLFSANQTRFIVLSTNTDAEFSLTKPSKFRGLIRITARPDADVGELIPALKLPIVRIDRRPSPRSRTMNYFLEVQAHGATNEREWVEKVKSGSQFINGTVLGVWHL